MEHEQGTSASLSPLWVELDALVEEVAAARVAVAAAQAHEAEVLARAVGLVEARTADRRRQGLTIGNDLPLREVSAELGAAMRVGDRTVQRRIDDAHTLVTRFSATFDAWRSGWIDRGHVSTIVDEGVAIADDERCARYEERVLDVARVESAGRLREIARVIAARVDPEASALRRAAAIRTRGVRQCDLPDGMGRVQGDFAAPIAHAIMDRSTQQALIVQAAEAQARRDGDGDIDPDQPVRTLDEIRADVMADLLLTGIPTGHHDANGDPLTGIRGEIHLTIPVSAAAGLDDEPTLLAGHGPVDSELARRMMAASSAWNRVLIDLPTGLPVAVDRYRPSAELQRFLDFRDERCRFPGCSMRAWHCDGDHTVDAATGGATCEGNLAALCRRHHVLKHSSPWTVEQLGVGRLQWISPTGRVYTDEPPAALRFVPTPEPTFSIPSAASLALVKRTVGTRAGHPPDDGDPPPF
ncbi:MAG: DUF222 domain-containing protein [Microbacterium sp.]